MVKHSLHLVLLLGSTGVAKENPIKLNESSLFSNLDGIITPSISSAPDFSVTVCQKPNIEELCRVKVTAIGFGAKKVLLLKRNSNGVVLNLASKGLDPSGAVEYLLKFEETGTYSVLFLAEDNSGNVLGLDGAVIYVEPSKKFFNSYSIDILPSSQQPSSYPVNDGGE